MVTGLETTKRYGRGNGPEFAMQKALFTFLRRYTPYWPLLFAVCNGAHVSDRERSRLVAEGMTAGIPDVYCSVPSGPYHGLYMELKCGDNRLTPWQKYYFELYSSLNYRCVEIRDDWLKAKNIFFEHLKGCPYDLDELLRRIEKPEVVSRGTKRRVVNG